ncbi:MAG: CBS domain-containing protein [Sedimenticola sp.]
MKLKEVLEGKSSDMVSATPGVSVLDGIQLMCDKKVGSVMVITESGDLQGILTERDILSFCAERNGDITGAAIDDAMTHHIIIATLDTSVEEAMTMMTNHRFRHLPIMDNGKPIAIISIGDLVKAKLKDMSVEVKYLRDYINT